VYFVTQNPLDVPDTVLGQLGNRVQHALRAFTPRDQKAVKAAAETLRPNPGLDVGAAITELAVGEALVSLLDAQGRPCPTERVFVEPPGSQLGPLDPAQRQTLRAASLVAGVYESAQDRESAYERLTERAQRSATPRSGAGAGERSGSAGRDAPAADADRLGGLRDVLLGSTGPRGGQRDGLLQAVAKSAARSLGSGLGRQILRGVLGGLLGGGGRAGARRRR
jgi:DNA helicase HerA-like ATPase